MNWIIDDNLWKNYFRFDFWRFTSFLFLKWNVPEEEPLGLLPNTSFLIYIWYLTKFFKENLINILILVKIKKISLNYYFNKDTKFSDITGYHQRSFKKQLQSLPVSVKHMDHWQITGFSSNPWLQPCHHSDQNWH